MVDTRTLEERLVITRRQLVQILRELKKWKAPATVLLTLYIPPGRPISDVMQLLRQEFSIADNIKLKKTRQAVQKALSSAMDRLSMIQKTPSNGLVVFCGEDMETKDFVCYVFSPPDKVPVFYYRTDKEFHTEWLEDMVEEREAVGIIVVERDQATIGLLRGTKLEVIEELEDYVPGKHKMGGQSQRRFDRIIEQMVENFFKRVGEHANRHFLPLLEKGVLKGIILAGPGYAKLDFLKGGYLDYRLQRIVARQTVDVAYQGIQGLKEAVLRAEGVIQTQLYRDAVNALEEFKKHLARDTGMAIYGPREVKSALEMGMVKTLLVHESRRDLDDWKSLGEAMGAEVVIVPESLPESEWFKSTFDGLAGILRFKPSR